VAWERNDQWGTFISLMPLRFVLNKDLTAKLDTADGEQQAALGAAVIP
jgi:hypothetical protein